MTGRFASNRCGEEGEFRVKEDGAAGSGAKKRQLEMGWWVLGRVQKWASQMAVTLFSS